MKKLLAFLLASTITVLAITPMTMTISANNTVSVDLSMQIITNEQLAELVANGTIPKNVTELNLSRNQISDLTPLSELTELRQLNLLLNPISDIAPLSELQQLNLSQNAFSDTAISDITPLSNLVNLQRLELSWNKISDITPLSNLVNLGNNNGWLDLSGNQINDISPLSELAELKIIFLVSNKITDLLPFKQLTELQWLDLSPNPITLEQVEALQTVLPDCTIVHDICNCGICAKCNPCISCTLMPCIGFGSHCSHPNCGGLLPPCGTCAGCNPCISCRSRCGQVCTHLNCKKIFRCGTCKICKPALAFKFGDINNDGNVGIADALEILKYLAQMDNLIAEGGKDSIAWKASLITESSQNNGSPGIGDALEIFKLLAGMDSLLKQ